MAVPSRSAADMSDTYDGLRIIGSCDGDRASISGDGGDG